LGVGYRPRTGTVFFTRNGRKMEDAFIGLSRWNLFPTVGADGPCSVHVNLGQAGFVFIEANVKKWGLAPSVGTLAPPPAYGSERGSILLDVGGRIRPSDSPTNAPGTSSPSPPSHHHRRSRRSRFSVSDEVPLTPPPPITPIDEDPEEPSNTADPHVSSPLLAINSLLDTERPSSPTTSARSLSPDAGSDLAVQLHPPPDSPTSPNNPPTPNHRDIHLQSFSSHRRMGSSSTEGSSQDLLTINSALSRRDPPAYSPIDAYAYPDGVHIDLPAELIAAALEGNNIPSSVVGQGGSSRSERRRSRRR